MSKAGSSAALIANAAAFLAGTAFAPVGVWAQTWSQSYPCGPQSYPCGPHTMWGGSSAGMIVGALSWVLVLAGVIGAIALLIRWIGPGSASGRHSSRSALDILNERFARGEIDRAEFDQRRRALEQYDDHYSNSGTTRT